VQNADMNGAGFAEENIIVDTLMIRIFLVALDHNFQRVPIV
jgi:hypothetical protein